ncbi:MAG: copper chaperone PCu(A)C [Burkholderiaceae bacterium]|nr:copper chaperone PCu(A)C [Burkholderiaceae bacterium]
MNKSSIQRLIATTALAFAALGTSAHSFKVGAIDIGHPYARPTHPGQQVGAGYLKLTNQGAADRLMSATSPAATSVEMHTMTMEGDVMKMRQVDAIDLPDRQTVELKPGGYHLMLMGLKAPLKAGDKLPLTLKFEKAGEVVVTVNVENPKPSEAATEHKH